MKTLTLNGKFQTFFNWVRNQPRIMNILSMSMIVGVVLLATYWMSSFRIGAIFSVWPATGILVAVLIVYGYRATPAVVIATMLAPMVHNSSIPSESILYEDLLDSLSIATLMIYWFLCLGEIFFSYWLYTLAIGKNAALLDERDVKKFFAFPLFLACLPVPFLLIVGHIFMSWPTQGYTLAINTWISHSTSIAVLTPLVLACIAEPRGIWVRRAKAVALPLLLAVGVIFSISYIVQSYERESIQQRYQTLSKEMISSTQARLENQIQALGVFKNFFESQAKPPSHEEFSKFSEKILEQYNYIESINLMAFLPDKQRVEFEKSLSRRYPKFSSIQVLNQEGKRVSMGKAKQYLVVTQSYPEVDWNLSTIGLNRLGVNIPDADVNAWARTSGLTSLSSPYLQNFSSKYSEDRRLSLVLPVYSPYRNDGDASVNMPVYWGNVSIVIKAQDWFNKLMEYAEPGVLSLCIYQKERPGVMQPIYDAKGACESNEHIKVYEKTLVLAGKKWSLFAVLPNEVILSELGGMTFLTQIIVMLGMSLLSFWLLRSSGRRHRIEALVAQRTRQITKQIQERKIIEKELMKSNSMLMIVYNGLSSFFSKGEGAMDVLLNELVNLSGSTCGVLLEVPDKPVVRKPMQYWFSERFPTSLKNSLIAETDANTLKKFCHWDPTLYLTIKCQIFTQGERASLLSLDQGTGSKERVYTACLPVTQGNRLLGVVWMSKSTPYDEFEIHNSQTILITCATVLLGLQDSYLRQRLHSKLAYQASHDRLTGLFNRVEFEHRLNVVYEKCKRQKNDHVICFLDLDRFKSVNDRCGHFAGDELLRQISLVIQQQVRTSDTLARMGGDEFALLLESCPMSVGVEIAEKIRKAVDQYRFTWEKKQYSISVSIGVVCMNTVELNPERAMKSADLACYRAKEGGRNGIHILEHLEDSDGTGSLELQMKSQIKLAIEQRSFLLYAQPIVRWNPQGYELVQFEILSRMTGADGRLVFPNTFIQVAERCHFAIEIDRCIVEKVIAFCAQCQDQQQYLPLLSINLSSQTLGDQDFLEFVERMFDKYRVSGQQICFDIAEAAAVQNMVDTVNFMRQLRAHGCQFALDDFGSGLSSFSYLKHLPVDYLKIDGMYVKDMCDDNIDFAMVKSINEIGQTLGKETIAEFVENQTIADKLHSMGVNYLQGYHIEKPLPLKEAIALWSNKENHSKNQKGSA